MKTRKGQYIRSVCDLGYFDHKLVLPEMEKDQNLACSRGNTFRSGQIGEARKFAELFKPGEAVNITLRYHMTSGTVLGFRRHKYRGWVMGVLMRTGKIKDITIDPKGFENCYFEDDLLQVIQDPNGNTVSILTLQDLLVIVSKK